jgi:hypothetical protein
MKMVDGSLLNGKIVRERRKRVESTIKPDKKDVFEAYCKEHDIPYNYVNIEKYYLFNFYCATQGESAKVKKLLDAHDAKYFVNESKNL